MPINFHRFDKSRRPLYRAIADELSRQIKRGDIEPGERLLTHRELSTLLGIARSTVRRAYEELGRRKLVDTGFGRGTFVRNPDADSLPTWSPLALPSPGIDLVSDRCPLEPSQGPRIARETPTGSLTSLARAGFRWFKDSGLELSTDRVLSCSGRLHALNIAILACTSSGDRIAMDRLSDPSVRQLCRLLDREVVPIDIDAAGTLPDSLSRVCQELGPTLVLLSPTLQYPTSVTMPRRRRHEIVRVLQRFGIHFLEDDCHRLWATNGPRPLVEQLPELGIYLGGFSRYTGLNAPLDFLLAPESLRTVFEQAAAATLGPLSRDLQRRATHLIESGGAFEQLARSRAELGRRRLLAERLFGPHLAPRTPISPHLWIPTPPGRRASRVVVEAVDRNVSICPGSVFDSDGRELDTIYLSLTGPDSSVELSKGLKTVAQLLGMPAAMRLIVSPQSQQIPSRPRELPNGSHR